MLEASGRSVKDSSKWTTTRAWTTTGEILGLAIGTTLGFSDPGTIALAVVHETGIHGGPSPRVVVAIAVVAGAFGTVVLLAELVG